MQDQHGFIWVGGYEALSKFNAQGLPLGFFQLAPFKGDHRNFIQTIAEDALGGIWFGSELMGLHHLDPRTENVTSFLYHKSQESVLSNTIIDLHAESDTTLWIATNLGLVHFDITTCEHTTIDASSGLADDYICSVVKAEGPDFFVLRIVAYPSFICLQKRFTTSIERMAYATLPIIQDLKPATERKIYFGGKNGVDYFLIDDIDTTTLNLKTRLLDLRINQAPWELPIGDETLTLGPHADLVEVTFGGTYLSSR